MVFVNDEEHKKNMITKVSHQECDHNKQNTCVKFDPQTWVIVSEGNKTKGFSKI